MVALCIKEMSWKFALIICCLCAITRVVWGRSNLYVTCGSVIKLMNTGHKVRLHSHDVKYGTGSGQQSVTGTELKEDVNSHWAIKSITGKHCTRGEPLKCGDQIRLEHTSTQKNLHSHIFASPLSGNQEISAYGENGIGDTGDHWVVVCDGDYWERDEEVMLRHVDTSIGPLHSHIKRTYAVEQPPKATQNTAILYLSVSGRAYGRPINGQVEVVGLSSPTTNSRWQTVEGLFIHPTDFNPKHRHEHTEL